MAELTYVAVRADGHVTLESAEAVTISQISPPPEGAIFVGEAGMTVRADTVTIWGDRLRFPGATCLILAREAHVFASDGKPAAQLTIDVGGLDATGEGGAGKPGREGADGTNGVSVDAWPWPDYPLRDEQPTKGGDAPEPEQVTSDGRQGPTKGEVGPPGGAGGKIHIAVDRWNHELKMLRLTARGGRGGRGGPGGQGGQGGTGGRGADAVDGAGWTRLGHTKPQPGGDGGAGATGADGGPGGPGGAGGDVEVIQGPDGPRILFNYSSTHMAALPVDGSALNIVVDIGRPGNGGDGGAGGPGGAPGRGGRGGLPLTNDPTKPNRQLTPQELRNSEHPFREMQRLPDGADGARGEDGSTGATGAIGATGSWRGFVTAETSARAHRVSGRFATLCLHRCDALLLQAGPGMEKVKAQEAEARLLWLRDLVGPVAARVHGNPSAGTDGELDSIPAGPFAKTKAGEFAAAAGLSHEIDLLTRIHAAAADRLRLLRQDRDMFGDPPGLVPIENAETLHRFAANALASLERCEAELAKLDRADAKAGEQAMAAAALRDALNAARDAAAATLERLVKEQNQDAQPIEDADSAVSDAITAFRNEARRTQIELGAQWQVSWDVVIGISEMIGFMPSGGFRMASMIAGQTGKLANVIHLGPPPGSPDEAAMIAMTTAGDDLEAALGKLKVVAARIGGADAKLLFMRAEQVDAMLAKVAASVPEAGMARLYLQRLLAAARTRADLVLQHNLRADAIAVATARLADLDAQIAAAGTALSRASATADSARTQALISVIQTVRMALFRPIFELVRCWRALTGEELSALLDPALFGGPSARLRLMLDQAQERIARERALAQYSRQARPPGLEPYGVGHWVLFTPESHPELIAALREHGHAQFTIAPPGEPGSPFDQIDVRILRIRPFLLGRALKPAFDEPIRVLIGIPREFDAQFGNRRRDLLRFALPFAQWRRFEYGWPAIANAVYRIDRDGTPKFEKHPRLDLSDAMDVELIGSAGGHDVLLTPYARWAIDASALPREARSGIEALALELHFTSASSRWSNRPGGWS